MVSTPEGARRTAHIEAEKSNGTMRVDDLIGGAGPTHALGQMMRRAAPRLLLAPGDPVRERAIVDAVATPASGGDTALAWPFRIVRRCVTATEALAAIEAGQVDVALLGADLHGLGADTLKAVVRTGVPLVVLGAGADEGAWAGRAGRHVVFLPANASPEEVRHALVAAFMGEALVPEPAAVTYRVPPAGTADSLVADAAGVDLQAETTVRPAGIVLAVVSARGSHGSTTVSINLAAALGRTSPSVLLDTDIVEPSVATALGLNPARNAYMVSLEEPGSDPVRWAVALEGELQRLDPDGSPVGAVLCGVPKPGLRAAFTPAFLTMLLSQLRLHYRYIVADVGSLIDESSAASASHRAVLSAADRVLVVATPDIVGLRRTATLLEALRRDHEDEPNRLALVLNRHRSRHHHAAAEIAQTLRVSVAAVVPEDADAFQRALSVQRPLVAFGRGRRGSAARAYHELAHLVEEVHREWRGGGAAAGLSIDGCRPVAPDAPAPLVRRLLSACWPLRPPRWQGLFQHAGLSRLRIRHGSRQRR